MLMATNRNEDHRVFDDEAHRRAREAMHAIADGLTDQGLDILGQEWDEAHYLKASNAWGARCDATVGANGTFTWDYRAAGAAWTDPAQITAMTMTLLAADSAAATLPPLQFPGQTLKSAVGLAARARGLIAHLADVIADPEFLELSADVEITNPARRERGAVRVRDNVLRWECKLACPGAGPTGLDATEITETIGRSVPQLRVLNARFVCQ
jgi:hypothetical protein